MSAAAAVTNGFFKNISETSRASYSSKLKLYHNVALDSLYISTGNDVISRSVANRTYEFILGNVQVAIS